MLNKFATGAPEPNRRRYLLLPEFLELAWTGDISKMRPALDDPRGRAMFINTVDRTTGMNALHIAVGRNNLDMAKLLIEAGIKIIPDGEGRMPSLIAALCETSEEMQDYIADEERKIETNQ
jgi:uncharacterized protein